MSTHLCVICNHNLDEYLSSVQDPESLNLFAIMHCKKCGLEQTRPQPEDLAPYYSSLYYGGRHGFTAKYCVWRRLTWVKKICKKKNTKLLDIGCGEGSFLLSAQKLGWEVYGTEFSPDLAYRAGLNVKKNLADFDPQAPFDCVTLWHSLEHMRNPQEVLRQVHTLLDEKGLLFIAVPNAAGWQARMFRAKWLHRDVPRHLFHFGPDSLSFMLRHNGFKIIKHWHHEFEYDLLGWSQSILNYMYIMPNVFFKILTGRKVSTGWPTKIFQVFLGVLFSLFALPLIPLSALFCAGGTLVIVATRENEAVQ